jgi:diguanylate cyclase (GGDEF)-like protein
LAKVDEGGDVFTKRYLPQVLERRVRSAHRTHPPLGLVFVDLDPCKHLNDRSGRNDGDLLLSAVATMPGPAVALMPVFDAQVS